MSIDIESNNENLKKNISCGAIAAQTKTRWN